jgi:hypothetical protein
LGKSRKSIRHLLEQVDRADPKRLRRVAVAVRALARRR